MKWRAPSKLKGEEIVCENMKIFYIVQGERKFFRVCLKWLAAHDTDAVIRNLSTIVDDGFGRWDDLYCLVDTPCEKEMFELMKNEILKDIKNYELQA